MGTSGVPGTIAMVVVAAETKTPMISLTPSSQPPSPNGQWLISIPQPPPRMVAAVVERMKKDNVKKAAYIGFSDSWGDLVYDALMKNVSGTSIEGQAYRKTRLCSSGRRERRRDCARRRLSRHAVSWRCTVG